MFAISTTAFVSILALASSLVVVVQAGDPRITCLSTKRVSTDITCATLLYSLGGIVDRTRLQLMNPGKGDCEQLIATGSVCVSADIRICKTKVTAGPGDTTCDGLATANGITKALFIDYNDDVDTNDCSGVVPGQKYCVAIEDYNY